MSEYKVEKVTLETTDFDVLILCIPEEDIEDKLTILSKDRGKIVRSYYEDFIISACITNINQFISHVHNTAKNKQEALTIRSEVVVKIIEYNPLFDPSKIVINRNKVLKMMPSDFIEDKSTKILTNTKHWEESYYDDVVEESPTQIDKKDKSNKKGKDTKDIPDIQIKDLPYNEASVWWSRFNKYVDIKEFSPEHESIFFRNRLFRNILGFEFFIVTTCVINFKSLFVMLDNLGLTERTTSPIIMHELYELCIKHNPFLSLEHAQSYFEDAEEDSNVYEDEASDCRTATNKTAMSNGRSINKKKSKPKFKDLSKERLLQLADNMKLYLIGQDEAIDVLSKSLKRASVGLKDPNRPIGTFLFSGKTGVGKTKCVKVIADCLIDSKENLITIDCSEYSAEHEYSKLIGSPNGYVGFDQGGYLTNAIAKNPFSVVVFDEVEKAHDKVHQLLLQVFDEGRLTDGKGKSVSFKDAIIIMTSNIGVKEIESVKKTVGFGDVAVLTEDKREKALNSALKNKFKPEFLNRIDSIVHFKSLEKDDYIKIIELELFNLNTNLKANNTNYNFVNIKFDKNVYEHIYKNGIDEDYGARPLKRYIEKEISNPIADLLLDTEIIEEDSSIIVKIVKDNLKFTIRKNLRPKLDTLALYEQEQSILRGKN